MDKTMAVDNRYIEQKTELVIEMFDVLPHPERYVDYIKLGPCQDNELRWLYDYLAENNNRSPMYVMKDPTVSVCDKARQLLFHFRPVAHYLFGRQDKIPEKSYEETLEYFQKVIHAHQLSSVVTAGVGEPLQATNILPSEFVVEQMVKKTVIDNFNERTRSLALERHIANVYRPDPGFPRRRRFLRYNLPS